MKLRCAVAVAAVALVVFGRTLWADFVNWDDGPVVVHNPHYKSFDVVWMFTATMPGGHWQPLTWMSYAVDHAIWGMRPVGFHLTNVVLHAACAVAVFLLLAELLRAAGHENAWVPAAIGAALWAIHPLRVESVAWVTERRGVLSGLLYVSAVAAYLRAQRSPVRWKWLGLSVGLTVLSLMSKAWAMTIPAVLILMDAYPLRRFGREPLGRIMLEKLPYAVLSGAAMVGAFFAVRSTGVLRGAEFAVGQRLAQAGYGLFFYPWKTVAPTGLSPLYLGDTQLNPFAARYVLSCAVILAITAVLILRCRRQPGLAAGWLAYIVLVSPVLGLAQVGPQAVADRYSYLAAIPFSALAAGLLVRASRGVLIGAGAAVALLGSLAFAQAGIWKDPPSLWNHAVARDPRNHFALTNRGFARLQSFRDFAGARADFEAAIALKADFAEAWSGMGLMRLHQGDRRGAIDDLTRAMRLGPSLRGVYINRAQAYAELERYAESVADFDEALRREALDPETRDRRAGVFLSLVNRARDRMAAGDRAGARADLDAAVAASPAYAFARRMRGAERLIDGDFRGVIEDYSVLLEAEPGDAEIRMKRGIAKFQLQDIRGALADLDESARLRPDSADILVNRGSMRRVIGDRNGAIADYERALRVAPPEWPSRAIVEAALNEMGPP